MHEQDSREGGSARQGDEEHEAHGGEGVDRVVEHLREEPYPQDLESEADRSGRRGQETQPGRSDPGRDHRARFGRRRALIAHDQREQAGHGTRPGNGEVARRHPDRGREPEAQGCHPERAAGGVERVEQPAAASDAACHERLTEDGQRRTQADRGGQHRHRERERARRKGAAEHEQRPETAGGRSEFEKGVAANSPRRRPTPERRSEAEAGEVAREHGRGRGGGGAEDEPRRAHPEELEAERGHTGAPEAEPEKPRHVADRARVIHRPIPVTDATAPSTTLATATSAGPRGRSKR